MVERTWRRGLEDIGAKVLARFPEAAQHLPGHTLGLSVLPRESIWPELHYAIDDEELRLETIEALERIWRTDGIRITGERWKQNTVLVVLSVM